MYVNKFILFYILNCIIYNNFRFLVNARDSVLCILFISHGSGGFETMMATYVFKYCNVFI